MLRLLHPGAVCRFTLSPSLHSLFSLPLPGTTQATFSARSSVITSFPGLLPSSLPFSTSPSSSHGHDEDLVRHVLGKEIPFILIIIKCITTNTTNKL